MKKLIYIFLMLISCKVISQQPTISNQVDWSLHRVVFDGNFDTVYKKTASWLTPEMFGAVGDGVTNDSAALQAMFDYGFDSSNYYFFPDKSYAIEGELNIYGGIIYGNNATIIDNYDGAQGLGNNHWMLTCAGSIGSWVDLSSNISKGIHFAYISDPAILNNIQPGSLVKFATNRDFRSLGRKQGEMKKVQRIVDTIVYFTEQFYDSYLISDTLFAAVVTPRKFKMYDLNIRGNKKEWSIGLRLDYIDNPIVHGCNFFDSYYAAVYLLDCYNGDFTHNAHGSLQGGAGYGIAILGTSMNIMWRDANAFSVRHPSILNSIQYGVPWNWTIKNITAKNLFAGMGFSTHENIGTGKFENCRIYLGLENADSSRYKGVWNTDSTYANDEVVEYNGILYESKQASNSGNDPEAFADTYWDFYNNETAGFYIDADNVTIKDCQVYGAEQCIRTGGIELKNLYVDGIECYNVYSGFAPVYATGQATVTNAVIDDMVIRNQVKKTNKWAVSLDQDTINNCTFKNIQSINAGGFFIANIDTGSVIIEDLSVNDRAVWVNSQSDSINILINNLTSVGSTGILDVEAAAKMNTLKISNLNIFDANGVCLNFDGDIENITLGTVFIQSEGNISHFIKSTANITNLQTNSFTSVETGDNFYYVENSNTINRGYIGGILIPDSFNDLLYVGAGGRPALEVISGKFDIPYVSRGDGSPEGVVSGRVGAVYYRRDGGTGTTLYVKETGTGNTGWVAK